MCAVTRWAGDGNWNFVQQFSYFQPRVWPHTSCEKAETQRVKMKMTLFCKSRGINQHLWDDMSVCSSVPCFALTWVKIDIFPSSWQPWTRPWTWQPVKWITAALSSPGNRQSQKLTTTCSPTSQPTAAAKYVAHIADLSCLSSASHTRTQIRTHCWC